MSKTLRVYFALSILIAAVFSLFWPLKSYKLLIVAALALVSEYIFDKWWEKITGWQFYTYIQKCKLAPYACIYNIPMWYWAIGLLFWIYKTLRAQGALPPLHPWLLYAYAAGILLGFLALLTHRKGIKWTLIPQITILLGIWLASPALFSFSLYVGIIAHVLEVLVNIVVKFLTGSFVWIYNGPLTYHKNATSLLNVISFAISTFYFIALGALFGVF